MVLSVGTRVESLFDDAIHWYPAVIDTVNPGGTFGIRCAGSALTADHPVHPSNPAARQPDNACSYEVFASDCLRSRFVVYVLCSLALLRRYDDGDYRSEVPPREVRPVSAPLAGPAAALGGSAQSAQLAAMAQELAAARAEAAAAGERQRKAEGSWRAADEARRASEAREGHALEQGLLLMERANAAEASLRAHERELRAAVFGGAQRADPNGAGGGRRGGAAAAPMDAEELGAFVLDQVVAQSPPHASSGGSESVAALAGAVRLCGAAWDSLRRKCEAALEQQVASQAAGSAAVTPVVPIKVTHTPLSLRRSVEFYLSSGLLRAFRGSSGWAVQSHTISHKHARSPPANHPPLFFVCVCSNSPHSDDRSRFDAPGGESCAPAAAGR